MKAEQITDIAWDVKGIKFDRSHRGIVWINKKTKIAFLGIPKCGNSSLRKQLHLDSKIVKIQDVPKEFFIFTVIRNPIERLVSAYIEAVQSCSSYPGGRFKHDLELSQDKIEFLDHLMKHYDDCTRFVTYLDKLTEWGFFEPHCVPQTIYLTDENGIAFQNVQIFGLNDLSPLERKMGKKFIRHNQSENPGLKKKLYDFTQNNQGIKDQIEWLYEYDLKLWRNFKLANQEPVLG